MDAFTIKRIQLFDGIQTVDDRLILITFEGLGNLSQLPCAKSLQYLIFQFCHNLTKVDFDTFYGLPSLIAIALSLSPVEFLDDIDGVSVFTPVFPTITSFYLSGTKLKKVTKAKFNAPKGALFSLSYTDVDFVEPGVFQSTKAVSIYLGANKLTNVPDDLGANLPNLQFLDLAINFFRNTTFGPALLRNSTALTKFHCYSSQVPQILPGIFDRLVNLVEIRLENNALMSISENLFRDQSKIVDLDLSNNKITRLLRNAFFGLKSVTSLILKKNNIQYIDQDAFSKANVPKLLALDLAYNNLLAAPNVYFDTDSGVTIARKYMLYNNVNLTTVPSSFKETIFANVYLFSMLECASQCFYFTAVDGKRNFYCSCAEGYFGNGFCEKQVADPIVSVEMATESVALQTLSCSIASTGDSVPCEGIDCNTSQDVRLYTPNFEKPFDVRLVNKTCNVSGNLVSCLQSSVYSAFKLDYVPDVARNLQCPYVGHVFFYHLNIIPPKIFSLESALHSLNLFPANEDFYVALNSFIPGRVQYTISTAVYANSTTSLSNILLVNNSNSTLVYVQLVSPLKQSGFLNISILATEELTRDTKFAAIINLTVYDCAPDHLRTKLGNGLCQNNGNCSDNGNLFDGIYTCKCPSPTISDAEGATYTYEGTYCETLVKNYTLQTSASAAADSTPTYVGIAVAVVFVILVALVVVYGRGRLQALQHVKEYHIFISYRVNADADIAELVCKRLQQAFVALADGTQIPVKCFFDAQDIQDGTNWKESFLYALRHSCLFVPLVSEAALAPMKHITPVDRKPDNLLCEFEMAVALAKEKRLNIFPILIGGGHRGMEKHPDPTHDRKLDVSKQIKLFDFSDYGPQNFPQNSSTTSPVYVWTTIASILSFQGVKVLDAMELLVFQKAVRRSSAWTPTYSSSNLLDGGAGDSGDHRDVKLSHSTADLIERILHVRLSA